MLNTQRFTGAWAVVAVPYLGRDLDAWIASRRWPAWTRPAWTRAALTAATCVAVCIPDWRRIEYPIGVRLDMARYPVRACDFMAAHGVRGRGFNDLQGGYQAWRFWPERERLPFMTGTPEVATKSDRNLLSLSQRSRTAWEQLDAQHHFDYVLLSRFHYGWGRLLDFLDADSTWALVFADDAAALYVRRGGPLDSVATRYAYRWLPAGTERIGPLGQKSAADTLVRRAVEAELLRQTRESSYNSQAFNLLARAAYVHARWSDARRYTEAALRAEPLMPGEHERLGMIALAEGSPSDALEEFHRERRLLTSGAGLELRFGQAYAAMGDTRRAQDHLMRALAYRPTEADARAALGRLGSSPGTP
jgi:tetratricopeptide (TPR) repeat protein